MTVTESERKSYSVLWLFSAETEQKSYRVLLLFPAETEWESYLGTLFKVKWIVRRFLWRRRDSSRVRVSGDLSLSSWLSLVIVAYLVQKSLICN